jgi:hypothetical protein
VEPGQLLYSLLKAAAPVAALLKYVHPEKGAQHRIYPLVAPQGTPRPYVCYQLISRVPETGSSKACRLGDVARVQLSLFADDYATLAKLTAAITKELDYAEPEPGVYLEPANQHDHHDPQAICLFRSIDYRVELP